ncbi:Hsp20 family protein [Catellatospora coxensis]
MPPTAPPRASLHRSGPKSRLALPTGPVPDALDRRVMEARTNGGEDHDRAHAPPVRGLGRPVRVRPAHVRRPRHPTGGHAHRRAVPDPRGAARTRPGKGHPGQLRQRGPQHPRRTPRGGQGRTRSEFRYGMFTRSVRLPGNADVSAIRAGYDKGVLEVTVPLKATEPAAKQIPITAG